MAEASLPRRSTITGDDEEARGKGRRRRHARDGARALRRRTDRRRPVRPVAADGAAVVRGDGRSEGRRGGGCGVTAKLRQSNQLRKNHLSL